MCSKILKVYLRGMNLTIGITIEREVEEIEKETETEKETEKETETRTRIEIETGIEKETEIEKEKGTGMEKGIAIDETEPQSETGITEFYGTAGMREKEREETGRGKETETLREGTEEMIERKSLTGGRGR
eukprot:TRINITY_DN1824_c0_g2_i12.p1 TRINITY_DN1824_c0_g2~~TRINITY_DN1824_c0_g2_i12.p1  ORF type:complete len:131 (-),score=36.42 TRINITY_DN1824_c0_g2_i12:416-808(-)